MPGGFGGMLSFEMKGGYAAAYRAIGRTKVCVLAVSLGGIETLITHPASMIHTHQTEEQRATAGISPGLIRLSVGIEDVEDIIADLDQALGGDGALTLDRRRSLGRCSPAAGGGRADRGAPALADAQRAAAGARGLYRCRGTERASESLSRGATGWWASPTTCWRTATR